MKKLLLVLIITFCFFTGCIGSDAEVNERMNKAFGSFVICKKSKISNNCFCCMKRDMYDNYCSFRNDSAFSYMSCDEAKNGFGLEVTER